MLRGWGIRIGCGLAAVVACLSLADSASAGKKTEHVLEWAVFSDASNGYDFELEAYRPQGEPPVVIASFEKGNSTATYIVRRPERLTRRRLQADFGALGAIDLKYRGRIRHRGQRNSCRRFSFGYGRMKGGLHLEGEDGFSRVRSGRVGGIVANIRARKRCHGKPGGVDVISLRGERDESSILATCGGTAGAGFAAVEFEPGSEGEFLAAQNQRIGDVQVLRTLSVSGATRRFAVAADRRHAKVRPPAPFEGRAEYRGGELAGNLRAPLPGAGLVRLTPSDGTLTSFTEARNLPKCFPAVFSGFGTSDDSNSSDYFLRQAFQARALNPRLRRAFAAVSH